MARTKPPSQRDKASRYEVGKLASRVNKALRAGAELDAINGTVGMAMAGVRPVKPRPVPHRPKVIRRRAS